MQGKTFGIAKFDLVHRTARRSALRKRSPRTDEPRMEMRQFKDIVAIRETNTGASLSQTNEQVYHSARSLIKTFRKQLLKRKFPFSHICISNIPNGFLSIHAFSGPARFGK